MNVFATEHPMTAQTSCFDTKNQAWTSFFSSILVLAFILLPFVAGLAFYSLVSDDAFTDDQLPDSASGFLMTMLTFCLLLAFVCVAIFRLLAWYFQSQAHGTVPASR